MQNGDESLYEVFYKYGMLINDIQIVHGTLNWNIKYNRTMLIGKCSLVHSR